MRLMMPSLPLIIMYCSWHTISTVMSIPMSCSSTMTSDFMEFYTIARFIFWSIESDIRKIIPDREECCIDEIREEKLIEHKYDSERNDQILMTHRICIKPGTLERCIHSCISHPSEKISNTKDITLLNHVDYYSTKSKKEKKTHEKI